MKDCCLVKLSLERLCNYMISEEDLFKHKLIVNKETTEIQTELERKENLFNFQERQLVNMAVDLFIRNINKQFLDSYRYAKKHKLESIAIKNIDRTTTIDPEIYLLLSREARNFNFTCGGDNYHKPNLSSVYTINQNNLKINITFNAIWKSYSYYWDTRWKIDYMYLDWKVVNFSELENNNLFGLHELSQKLNCKIKLSKDTGSDEISAILYLN